MREDMGLYRGKRKDNGEWVEGDLRHGGYYLNDPEVYICCRFADTIINYPVDPNTVGEFTGQHDINSKKIFEDDVVSASLHGAVYQYPCSWNRKKIVFAFGAFCVQERDKHIVPLLEYSTVVEIEVIGNIHDNPELLK